MNVVLTNCT